MSVEENKAVVLRLTRAVNSGNLDDLNYVLAPNYIRHDPNPLMKDMGREESKQTFRKLRAAFTDAKWTLDEILNDGDKVVGRWTFRGTQNGPLFNIPPSGRVVTYPIWQFTGLRMG